MAYQDINGIKLHYTDIGEGDTVVLLHGLGSCGDDWQPQQDTLRKHFRVICIDLRGHGLSDKPNAPYSFELFADDVNKLVSKLGISKYHLVGFSMGGMTAFQLTTEYPDKLLSLTVINSGPSIPQHRLALRWSLHLRVLLIRLLGLKSLGHLIGHKLFPLPQQRSLRQRFFERMKHNDKTGYLRSLNAFHNWDVSEAITKLNLPVLIIAADQDYTPVTDKLAYQETIPNSRLIVIEDSRHATPLDQPIATNQALLDFFQEVGHCAT